MKYVPNILSISRIILCFPLIVLTPFTPWFMAIYIIAGITDMIDGPLARKTGNTSPLGANLDGGADVLFALIVLFRIMPAIVMPPIIVILIFVVVAMKFLALFIAYIRHKELVLMHTYANKFAAFALFLFPLFYTSVNTELLLWSLIVIVSIAFLEEIMISSLSKQVSRDLKSIFFMNK